MLKPISRIITTTSTFLIGLFILAGCQVTAKDFANWEPAKRNDKIKSYITTAFSEVQSDLEKEEEVLQAQRISGVRYETVSYKDQGIVAYDCYNPKGKHTRVDETKLPDHLKRKIASKDLTCQAEYGDIVRSMEQPIPLSESEKASIVAEMQKIERNLASIPEMRRQYLETAEKNMTFMSAQQLFDHYAPTAIKQNITTKMSLLNQK